MPGPSSVDSPPPGVTSTEEAVRTTVLAHVRELLCRVMGEDYLADIEVGFETSFNGDLELESIEFVALAEALRSDYGETVDFVAWMAEMEVDEIIALTVGELVNFISARLMSAPGAPDPLTAGDARG